jgi:hypothetical protein
MVWMSHTPPASRSTAPVATKLHLRDDLNVAMPVAAP